MMYSPITRMYYIHYISIIIIHHELDENRSVLYMILRYCNVLGWLECVRVVFPRHREPWLQFVLYWVIAHLPVWNIQSFTWRH